LKDRTEAKKLLVREKEIIIEEFKLKLITKKQYLEKAQKIEDKIEKIETMYRKGGKI
jgi:hypothetical protein